MTNDPRQILREARNAARRGAHAEALEKYLWFHHHALEHDSALAGVRLSYAVSEWVELSKVYPPALEALESLQSGTLTSLRRRSNDRKQFHDFASINEHLGRFDLTSDLFSEVAESEHKFADSSEKIVG